MRIRGKGIRRNLEDRRGRSGLPRGGRRFGLGGLSILVLLSLLFRRDLLSFFGGEESASVHGTSGPPHPSSEAEEELVHFVSFVLDDVQSVFGAVLTEQGRVYPEAKLVLFTDRIRSACGLGEVAVGPFYCPSDRKAYIDLGFYRELRERFGAPGDFAQAYVLAHELGHHLQNVLGTEAEVRRRQNRNPNARNELSVRMELQADCFAGVWARHAAERELLSPGDLQEGMNAAAAIGDDRLQRMGGDVVQPERFTHGTGAQRVTWLRRGFENGRLEACDTFTPDAL